MAKRRLLFLCHFSTKFFRKNLHLKDTRLRQYISELLGKDTLYYDDFAIWVSDYIEEFADHPEYEFHIVSPHKGMHRNIEHFEHNGIFFHFYKCTHNFIYGLFNKLLHIEERNNYKLNREKINKLVREINPDLIMLCGAENPYYSLGILDINNIPIYVILQTFLNDPKRIAAKIASDYRIKMEAEVFKHANFFSTDNQQEIEFISTCNNNAVFMPSGFPTHRPKIDIPRIKKYDFVFFAREVLANKGIEDVIKALSIVKKSKSNVTLNIIGKISQEYNQKLQRMILDLTLENNIHFAGYYEDIHEVYKDVVTAKVVVVPGITAALNSTVRESMHIGMPTIVYETSAIPIINRDHVCLFVAKMQDIEELAQQMRLSIENDSLRKNIALNGKEYAERVFSNKTIVNKLLNNCQQILEYK